MYVFFFSVKYLGLLAMSKILKTHPKSVQAHKDLILQCLEDKDESIRLRALDLLYGMVSNGIILNTYAHLVLLNYYHCYLMKVFVLFVRCPRRI